MNETDIKYLAGLLDADGSFYFTYTNSYCYLNIDLDLSTGIDRDMKFTTWLCSHLGVNPKVYHRTSNAVGVDSIKITVSKRSTLENLIPRLLKYLVIKGGHLERMTLKWKELRGIKCSPELIGELKQFSIDSRNQPGPIREKSWLPKAYVAGYIDGDGCYSMKKSSGTYNVSTVAHVKDRVVSDLLLKQYGGRIHYQEDWIRWVHPLGRTNKSFAVKFLRDMHKHSKLKKFKIEQFLHYHSQRLTEETPAGEIIV